MGLFGKKSHDVTDSDGGFWYAVSQAERSGDTAHKERLLKLDREARAGKTRKAQVAEAKAAKKK
jgi:hypothetical protein